MGKEAENLTHALKGDSKTQGNWGEIQIENILQKVGLQEGLGYVKEENLKDQHVKEENQEEQGKLEDLNVVKEELEEINLISSTTKTIRTTFTIR